MNFYIEMAAFLHRSRVGEKITAYHDVQQDRYSVRKESDKSRKKTCRHNPRDNPIRKAELTKTKQKQNKTNDKGDNHLYQSYDTLRKKL